MNILLAAALAVAATPALSADVRVSVHIGEPGYYGIINVTDYPPPQLIYAEPIIIQAVPVGVVRQPVYLHLPPGHAKNWRKHCRKYNACGAPVYFVQNRWYNDVYVPHYRETKRKGHDRHPGKGKKHKDR